MLDRRDNPQTKPRLDWKDLLALILATYARTAPLVLAYCVLMLIITYVLLYVILPLLAS
ncbi:MAG: hypothetical protein HY335_06670 [Deinococcus sp.]|nr:hypothetical protein [Deinococcus sp.]